MITGLIHINGPLHAVELPEVEGGCCCYGAAVYGAQRCTCWEPVHDLDQAEPVPAAPATRATACTDCAYRPDSPERNGAKGYAGDAETLEEIVEAGKPFYCHQGIRRAVRLRHPAGLEVDNHAAAYQPPIVDGVPYRADGTPADVCAGWAARAAKAATSHQEKRA